MWSNTLFSRRCLELRSKVPFCLHILAWYTAQHLGRITHISHWMSAQGHQPICRSGGHQREKNEEHIVFLVRNSRYNIYKALDLASLFLLIRIWIIRIRKQLRSSFCSASFSTTEARRERGTVYFSNNSSKYTLLLIENMLTNPPSCVEQVHLRIIWLCYGSYITILISVLQRREGRSSLL